MLTDDDVVTQLRGSYAGSVASVSPDPSLLARVRHDHHRLVRRQRALIPAGVAVLGLGGIYVAWPSPPPAAPQHFLNPTPTPTVPAPGPTVKLFDYAFTLPSGFVVEYVKNVDLSKAQPPQPVHGKTAFFAAHSADRTQSISLTVYRGPIADAEATVVPPNPASLRTRMVAGFLVKTYSFAVGGPQCITRVNGRTVLRSPAPASCAKEAQETRLTTAPHEVMFLHTDDLTVPDIDAVLESGLA